MPITKKLVNFYQLQRRYWEYFLADGVVLSFPKCGRTWMRIIFDETLPDKNYYVNKNLLSKSILSNTFWDVIFNKKKYIRFSHDPKFANLNIHKSVLLVRHPFDATTSLYYHQKFKSFETREEFIDKFFLEKLSDILIFYKKFIPLFLEKGRLIKYEDNVNQTYEGFSKTLKLLNCEFENEKLKNSIENNNFKNLQKKEKLKIIKKKDSNNNKLHPKYKFYESINPNKIDINQLKFRKGKINSYKNDLSDKTIKEAKKISRRIFSYSVIDNNTIRFLEEYKIF